MPKTQKKKKKTNIRRRKRLPSYSGVRKQRFSYQRLEIFFLQVKLCALLSVASPEARLLSDDSNHSSHFLQTEHFDGLCSVNLHRAQTHLNKCRYEIYRTMRPACQSDTQLNANAVAFFFSTIRLWIFTNVRQIQNVIRFNLIYSACCHALFCCWFAPTG